MLAPVPGSAEEADRETLVAGRYRVLSLLGRGGMGAVYRVEDSSSGAILALKRALELEYEGPQADKRARAARLRFRREFHTLASLRHPRIVEAHGYGRDDLGEYYTMELLDGFDLRELGVVAFDDACRLLRDVCAALALLHGRGLVHRDLAPRNVRCTYDGRAKLIDFGLLATVGAVGEVAGTPAFMAPESRRRLALDGRTDLFSLGVLAYWMVTGRAPFPARDIHSLEKHWKRSPPPPSSLVDGVPAAFDELVGSLLSIEPLGRPASAAEVMDRLTELAGLPHEPELAIAEGYLASAATVGRRAELRAIREEVAAAVAGRGRSVHLRAPSGTGKSRLLREAALEAQIGGAIVLTARCEKARWGSYGVLRELVREALDAAPDAAAAQARVHAPILARVFPDLAERLGPVEESVPESAEPAEERLRIQQAMAGWIGALACERPVALLVDDVQRCDEASAAVLAGLARERADLALLVCTAQRKGEPSRAEQAVRALADADLAIELAGLSAEEVEDLVMAYFGPVQHAGRLARWLHERTGGSPLHCAELVRSLVDAGVVAYVDGLWTIPMDVATAAQSIEGGLRDAMNQRVEGLSDAALEVAHLMAVRGGEVGVHRLASLCPDLDEDALFAGLDELVAATILVGAADRYRFRHDGLREALLRQLDPEARVALHRRIGETMAREVEPGDRRGAEVGFHLRAGGQTELAVEYLEVAGRDLFHVQALADCIAPLEAALELREAAGVLPSRLLDLRFMLLAAGWISDRETGLKHMDATVEALRAHSGIRAAARIGRYLGRYLGLALGSTLATLRWLWLPRRERGPAPVDAMSSFALSVGYACGLMYANHDHERLRATAALVEPMGILPRRIPYAAYLGMSAFPDLLVGRLRTATAKMRRALEIFQFDRLMPMTDFERRFAMAGMRGLIGQCQVANLDAALAADMAAIKQLDLRYYDLVADVTEATGLRFRGYEAKAESRILAVEAESLRLGSWSTDVQLVLFAHPPRGMYGDLAGLRHDEQALRRLVDEGFDYRARLAMTRGDLARARGSHEKAIQRYHAALEALPEEERLTRQWILCGLAEAERALHRFQACRSHARQALEYATDPETGQVLIQLRASRVLALAEAGLGKIEAAERRLAAATAQAEELEAPGIAGMLHEAQARVALQRGDGADAARHTLQARRWFHESEHPALIARGERLCELLEGRAEAGLHPDQVSAVSDAATTVQPDSSSAHTDAEGTPGPRGESGP